MKVTKKVLTNSVYLVVLLQLTQGKTLPEYIKACSRNDPKLNECAMKNGQAAISRLVLGDKHYKIPAMVPLDIPQIQFDPSPTLKINLQNVKIYGLEETEVKDAIIDLENKHMKIVVHIPKANLQSDYDIKGRILVLPIQGHGLSNLTLVGGTFTYDLYFDLQEKKGDQYIVINKNNIAYESKRMYFQFDNLFNGDPTLGPSMNAFLNENWKDVSKDIAPALTETISQIITSIVQAIIQRVPYKEILLP